MIQLRRVIAACFLYAALVAPQAVGQPPSARGAVKNYEGMLTIPTYEHSVRETEPPLFRSSSLTGLYPFTTYSMPFKPDGPKPKTYRAIFLENEYLKLTYLPEFGGRIFSVYDKVRKREVFYRNDVIKPAHYNPRNSWPQSGVELTGPHDLHMLTLYGEPFWSNKIVRHEDGSVSLVLGELDPVYHMKVNLTATLHPGIAAMQITVFCYNGRTARMPQMFWISSSLPGTPKTRFIYPMTRTIGHTTSEIGEWPVFNGVDYSWDRNNKNMLGVFGIDIYDDFQGAYHFDQDYGVFRYADRRVVQGMKMWTFGYGPASKNLERGYTDNAGPYVEVQSGRHVWDGHYEWVGPHKVETWSEWWIPVAGIDGLTTIRRDVALNLDVRPDAEGRNSSVKVALSAARVAPAAKVSVRAKYGTVLETTADLAPDKPFVRTVTGIPAGSDGLKEMTVTVTDSTGRELLEYKRPDENPGRKEYTPFTRPLEKPHKTPDQMSVEELTLAAEYQLKELDAAAAMDLFKMALERDPGFSRAHLLMGIHHYRSGRYKEAATHLEKAIERDPHLDEAHYYLAMSQFGAGEDQRAERNLYYIWPESAFFGAREYHLGRVALLKEDYQKAAAHLDRSIVANGYDLNARFLLAHTLRRQGNRQRALEQLAEMERIDPTNRPALAERYFLSGDEKAWMELLRLMGGQSQEAIDVSLDYRRVSRWSEASQILRLVEQHNQDPWGTPAIFYYTMAHCLKQAGDPAGQQAYLKKAQAAAGNIDRFPYREESEVILRQAVEANPKDAVARFLLGSLLYHRERPAEAIEQWEAAAQANPKSFQVRRALGLAYADQGHPLEKAAAELQSAVEVNPAHVRTLNDLSSLYAKEGRFKEQLAILQKALERSPEDDDLAESVLAANLIMGRYDEAEKLIAKHRFAPRHRSYGLRDKYRLMRYGMAAEAFQKNDFANALRLFEESLKPPVSLGVDDFQFQSTPRVQYYVGRTLEALGRKDEARQAFEKAVEGVGTLSGDRDSLSSDNYFMVLALERLGRREEADRLEKRFEEFARSQLNARPAPRRAEASYLLGLVAKRAGNREEAGKRMQEAVKALPDFLPARLELRSDVLDPIEAGQ